MVEKLSKVTPALYGHSQCAHSTRLRILSIELLKGYCYRAIAPFFRYKTSFGVGRDLTFQFAWYTLPLNRLLHNPLLLAEQKLSPSRGV